MNDLTPKQQKWLEEYLICWNATEAARKAGYSNTRVSGHRNVTNDNIRAEISTRLTELSMSADEVIARLADHARADMSDFVRLEKGEYVLDLKQAQERGKMHLVKKMKHTKYGLEIEFHDAQSALVHLGKVHGIFIDRVRLEDWKLQAVEDIRAGQIAFEHLAKAFDRDLATELFREAGVPVPIGEGTESIK